MFHTFWLLLVTKFLIYQCPPPVSLLIFSFCFPPLVLNYYFDGNCFFIFRTFDIPSFRESETKKAHPIPSSIPSSFILHTKLFLFILLLFFSADTKKISSTNTLAVFIDFTLFLCQILLIFLNRIVPIQPNS